MAHFWRLGYCWKFTEVPIKDRQDTPFFEWGSGLGRGVKRGGA